MDVCCFKTIINSIVYLQAQQLSFGQQKYLQRLLYNGFYCWEIMTERSMDNVICGICGTIGQFYLGDGNQKNCCSLKGVLLLLLIFDVLYIVVVVYSTLYCGS